jgi:hypothetical protein
MRVSRIAEGEGIPAVALVSTGFLGQARLMAKALGVENATIVEYPGVIPMDTPETLAEKVSTTIIANVVAGLGANAAAAAAPMSDAALPAEPDPAAVVMRGSLDDVLEHFHERQWTDGLPIVPPTPSRVDAFLAMVDRHPDDVIGVLAPEMRKATVRSVAVNGVMAGCRPEYMPLLVAAVEALADPSFRIQDAGSTPGWEPLVVVSGPMVERLGFNSKGGLMRVGRQANTSIGRFVRLYMRNVAGFRPGGTDKGSIGYTFNVAMAEDDEATALLGWQPFRADQGFSAADDVVTVQSVVAVSPPIYSGGADPLGLIEPLLHYFAGTAGAWAFTGVWYGHYHPLILMSPAVASAFAAAGWGKAEIRRHLYDNLRISARWLEHYPYHVAGQDVPLAELVARGVADSRYAASDDPERLVTLLLREEWTNIVVAGDPGRNQSRIYINNHEQGPPVSKLVR